MNYSGIKFADMVNGKGIRVSLFVSGCSHECKGCFNSETWDESYGETFNETHEEQIFAYFYKNRKSLSGLSLLGGDPTFEKNLYPLTEFAARFKEKFPEKDIWIWSGFTWEEIVEDSKKYALISKCDVLIDGKFVLEEKDMNLKWRGSRNQRAIDIKKSIENNKVVEYIK